MKSKWIKTKHTGVMVWHEKDCPAYAEKRCRCTPTFRGELWNSETKRPDKSRRFATVDEARGWVTDRRRGVQAPAPAVVGGVSVSEFFASFIAAGRAGTALRKGDKPYTARTLDKYERNFGHHIAPHVAGKTTGMMDARAWQLVVNNVITTGQRDAAGDQTGEMFRGGTVNAIMAAMKAAYRWGSAPGQAVVDGNPLRDVVVPKAPKTPRKRVAAPETIPALLDALKGRRDHRGPTPNPSIVVAWAIMFYAGLRVSETVALDWADVELTRDGGWITVGESKTEAGQDRRVPIAAPLARILREHRGDSLRIGPLLPGSRTLRLTDSGVADTAKKRWTACGLPDYSPHEARHTFASVVISNRDVSLADLQEWLGHASLQTTAIYVKTLPGWRQESRAGHVSAAFAG